MYDTCLCPVKNATPSTLKVALSVVVHFSDFHTSPLTTPAACISCPSAQKFWRIVESPMKCTHLPCASLLMNRVGKVNLYTLMPYCTYQLVAGPASSQ